MTATSHTLPQPHAAPPPVHLAVALPAAARAGLPAHYTRVAADHRIETRAVSTRARTVHAVLYRLTALSAARGALADALATVVHDALATPAARAHTGDAAFASLLERAAAAVAPAGRVAPGAPAPFELATLAAAARAHAEAWAADLWAAHAAAATRAHAQLAAHFAAAIDETPAAARAELAARYARERDALALAWRVRATAVPLAVATVRWPERVFDLALRDTRRELTAALGARVDLARGALAPEDGCACGAPDPRRAVCAAGPHAACDACVAPCPGCAAPVCAACVRATPPGRACEACGERACAAHLARCAACDAPHCALCLSAEPAARCARCRRAGDGGAR